MLGGLLVVA